MQLIDTRVGKVSEGTVTVEFQGEGGELGSVRMATHEDLDGDAAVRRAKEIMVQLTSFGAADRDGGQGDATSVGAIGRS